MFSKILVKSKGGGDHRQLLVQQRGSPENFLKSQKLHQSERGGHWDLRYGGISLFFLRYFGIFLEKLRYYDIGNLAVHGICNFGLKTAVIDKICLQYYGIEYPPMPPS